MRAVEGVRERGQQRTGRASLFEANNHVTKDGLERRTSYGGQKRRKEEPQRRVGGWTAGARRCAPPPLSLSFSPLSPFLSPCTTMSIDKCIHRNFF